MSKPEAAAAGPITTILRPDGTTTNTGWARTGGATDHGVLADDSDATYLTGVGNPELLLTFGTAAALGTIHSVTTRLRVKMYGSLGSYADQYDFINVYQNAATGNNDPFEESTDPGSGTTVTKTGFAYTTRPSGGAWTQADVDGLVMRVILGANASADCRVIEAYYVVSHTP